MALGLAMAALAGGARADGPPPVAAAAGCDFFQAELIGVLCGGTGYVAPGVTGGEEVVNGATTVPVAHGGGFGRGRHGFNGGAQLIYGSASERWDDQSVNESLTLAVSPFQGFRMHVTGEAFQYQDDYTLRTANGVQQLFAPGAHGVQQLSASGAYGGWQGFGAEATVWDQTTETGRYVLNVSGGLQFTPGGGLYSGRDLQQIGWESGAQWRLGASGLTVDYFSATFLQRFDNPGEIRATSGSRLLLSSADWGVAIGPRIDTTSVLWHAADLQTGWSEVLLGGEALIAPFRRTAAPVLRDMTLDLSAAHSLGQAGLVPDWAGSSSRYVYSASARFNFRY
jgi:hypothetical protein